MKIDDTPTELMPAPARGKYCPWCGAEATQATHCTACELELVDLRLGRTLDGKYRIDSLLAEGGMGRVYRATHLRLKEAIVVKFLLSEWASNPELRARFRREAEVLARLRHPAIVTIYDFGEDQGSPFLVMELLRGVTLTQVLTQGDGPLPSARLGILFDQLLEVLEASHRMGVVHRDLKPENVMLLENAQGVDRIKVLDFGVALVLTDDPSERLTRAGGTPGTPAFMSPEQCQGGEVGPPSDIYALGIMLYEALAGEVPFSGRGPMEIFAKQMFTPPPPIAQRGWLKAPPAGLGELVTRLLVKDPAQRPSASVVREELRLAIIGLDPASRAERAGIDRSTRATLIRAERVLGEARTPGSLDRVIAGYVAIGGQSGARCDELCLVLAVNGLRVTRASADLQRDVTDPNLVGLLIEATSDIDQVLRQVRSVPRDNALSILVFDVTDPGTIPLLIRAGVSDVTLAGLADGLICRHMQRLLQRQR